LGLCAVLILLPPASHCSQTQNEAAPEPESADSMPPDSIIPVGTRITMANWRKYKLFMPDGMIALFEGTYYWKMPPGVQMEVGPVAIHPLPKAYREATERNASQVKLIKLADGGLSMKGYRGGTPFPNPTEPEKGWKILANFWYRYIPHLLVDTYGTGCYVDSVSGVSCTADEVVYRQLSFNTDPGIPTDFPGAEGKFYSQWSMSIEPEQQRYHGSLRISYSDLSRPEDAYVFVPALRRHQAVSTSARCAPSTGSDATPDD